jgi:hypothetical protein
MALTALFGLAFLYQIYVGGDPWLYWRMLAPFVPLALVLIVVGVAAGFAWVAQRLGVPLDELRSKRPAIGLMRGLAACAVLGFVLLDINSAFADEIAFRERPYLVDSNVMAVNTGLVLAEITTPEATVGVLWAGAAPYYSGRRGVDFLGKTDPDIARLLPDVEGGVAWGGMRSVPGHNKYDLNYSIVELTPTYIQRYAWGQQNAAPFVQRRYAGVRYKGMNLLLLKGSPHVRWNLILRRRPPAVRQR